MAAHPLGDRPLTRRSLFRASGALALAAGLGGGLAACGGGTGSGGSRTLRVSWFGGDDRHERTLKAFSIIEKKIEGLKTSAEYGGFEGYFDKLTTQISGGNAPAVVQTNFPLTGLAGRNALTDLTAYAGKELDLSGIPESDRRGGYFEDKLYGVSLGTLVPAAIVDTTALGELDMKPPQTWDWDSYAEFAADVAKESGGRLPGTEDASSYGQILDVWLMHRGLDGIHGQDGSVQANLEDVADWFAYWQKLRKSGAATPIKVQAAHNNGDHPTNPVVTGKAAVALQFNSTRDVWASLTEHELAYQAMPTGGPGAEPGNYARPSALWSVPRGTEDVDLAVQVIDLFLNDPEVARALGTSRAVPNANALKALGDDLSDSDRELIDFTRAVLDGELGSPPTSPPKAVTAGTPLKQASEEIAFGRAGIREATETYLGELKKQLA